MRFEWQDEPHAHRSSELAGRLLCIVGGAALLIYGLRRDVPGLKRLGGAAIAALGAVAMFRERRGSIRRLVDTVAERADSIVGDGTLQVARTMTIARPPDDLYAFWRRFENLPRFMRHLDSVERLDERRSRWTATGPLGTQVRWESEVTRDVPGQEIAWRSLPGEGIENRGVVRFRPSGHGATELQVQMQYRLPAGRVGATLAKLFGEEPQQQIDDDLRRFKRLVEAGALQPH